MHYAVEIVKWLMLLVALIFIIWTFINVQKSRSAQEAPNFYITQGPQGTSGKPVFVCVYIDREAMQATILGEKFAIQTVEIAPDWKFIAINTTGDKFEGILTNGSVMLKQLGGAVPTELTLLPESSKVLMVNVAHVYETNAPAFAR